MTIGENIKKYRKEKGLTQKELAEKSNLSRSYLADLERDRYNPSLDSLKLIANSLEVDVSILLGENNSTIKISNTLKDDKELLDFWNILKEREDLQLLFKQTKDLSPKGIQQVIRIIKAIEDEEDRENE
ncbi:helix-turn-helix domain-containing protein [Tissierella carlieri]|jgi:transcriptional regulator with XRE-family HTH domain|uniref:helix-turn-helix domain-containing protein n=1 Tax=Tissierella TaxID=41273 RepID=UPI001C1016D3|nr:helix-turn-helix domain-containing protein [Tissierella carlieri]MBU5314145.1 helix-turn-helix domain-containing protein [Tissierella carlieri]